VQAGASSPSLEFRWLGVAGAEYLCGGQSLLVDPFLSRVSAWRLLAGPLHSDAALIAEKLPRADAVLVSHAHYDHLLDVPEVVRHTGARAFGSAHTCRLLAVQGIAAETIAAGDRLDLGAFAVEVLPARHLTILGRVPYAGALPAHLEPPLAARDYRMDVAFGFLISAGGSRVLDWRSADPGPAPAADVLLVTPHERPAYYAALLTAVRPRLVLPNHWDDYFRPLSKSLRASFAPPAWAWPPLRRMDLARFKRIVGNIAPQARVLVPEIFAWYEVG
jgi:L-ascorbate metabolism protein UlaG (beta-lactamase superfamily)